MFLGRLVVLCAKAYCGEGAGLQGPAVGFQGLCGCCVHAVLTFLYHRCGELLGRGNGGIGKVFASSCCSTSMQTAKDGAPFRVSSFTWECFRTEYSAELFEPKKSALRNVPAKYSPRVFLQIESHPGYLQPNGTEPKDREHLLPCQLPVLRLILRRS